MNRYSSQKKLLAAVDCIVFGFDDEGLKILLIQRAFEPEKGKWSLMGGFIQPDESSEDAASRILKKLTGLEGVYLEELKVFSDPYRDMVERTISIVYFALINIHDYEKQISHEYHAEWFSVNKFPKLIFDHNDMVSMGRKRLQYKAAMHPILLELLPEQFTLPQLQGLYEGVYDTRLDKRNFIRKVISTGLLIRQDNKEKESSRKGAFYYKINKKSYKQNFQAFLNIIPNAHNFF